MKNVRNMICAALVMVTTAFGAMAEDASRPVLLVQLPEDAQMIENVEFDDGDFIQTYQLSGGANVQLLRYADFDMEIDDLIESEWVGATDVLALDVASVGGYPAGGVRFRFEQEGQDTVSVALVLVSAGSDTLVFQAVYPMSLGEEQIDAMVASMTGSMDVLGGSGDVMPEVG